MPANDPAIGIIGGSGLYELEGLTDVKWRKVATPFGAPSDAYCVGRFAGRRVIFLPRHGRGHRIMPTELNFRANIWGLKALGAEWVISISAVGSMKEAIRPLDLVVPDQFFDATRRRVSSFFGDGIVAHVGMPSRSALTWRPRSGRRRRRRARPCTAAGPTSASRARSSLPGPSRASIVAGAWTSSG